MEPVAYRPIGVVRSPFRSTEGMPIQAVGAAGVVGRVELDPAFAEGLADIGGFSHLVLLYHLHEVRAARLTVTPFLDTASHGVFATRSPARPNAIGMSTVRLLSVDGCTLEVGGIDILDGTPLLDIKPYVPQFDDREGARIGWYADRVQAVGVTRADGRFR
ncbi:MAG: tRNA (N6-threonylcarbamoyladenosine(37)-N6)-methyltransferase TrmO [Chloroflexota bacterium]